MEKPGRYRFVLHIKDNHPYLYKDHQSKWAIDINQPSLKKPIEYFKIGGYNVLWCRAECMSYINKRTEWFEDGGYSDAPQTWADADPIRVEQGVTMGTEPSHIRGAVNGGLFHGELRGFISGSYIIGDVGYGDTGDWEHGHNAERRRWAFGMDATGSGFNFMRMVIDKSKEAKQQREKKKQLIYMVPPHIENSYAYGRSNVGLLVYCGGKQKITNSAWDNGSARRTAIAWSVGTRKHFFLVSTEENVSWDDMASFFAVNGSLSSYMNSNKKVNFTTECALMMDGGASTSLSYLRRSNSGSVDEEDDDGVTAVGNRYIPDIVGVGAAYDPR